MTQVLAAALMRAVPRRLALERSSQVLWRESDLGACREHGEKVAQVLGADGFVEGDGIGAGAADVIVSEGFSGNIALKAAEGTARQMADFLRNAMASSWQSKIGYLFARSAFKALRDKLDPNKSNGGVLLGLKGVVVKSHGGINAEGFAYAVDVGYEMVRCDLLTKISALTQAQIAQEVVS